MVYLKKTKKLKVTGAEKNLGEQLRTYRLLKIYNYLLNNGRVSKEWLCNNFNISTRTAERDISLLKCLPGLCIESKRENDGLYYCLDDNYRNQRIFINQNQELITLLFSLALCHFSSTAEKDLKDKFTSAIRSVFPFSLAEHLFYYHDEAPYLKPLKLEDLMTLINAYKNKRCLSLKLRHKQRLNFKLFKIIHYVDEFYIAGQVSKDRIIILSLHDIEEINILKKTYSIPADFSIDKYLESAFGIIPGKKDEVVLFIKKEIADYIKKRSWHPSQQIEKQEDGSIILKMHVTINEELIKWILSYGEKIKVHKPERLKNIIKKEARKISALYKNDTN